jgi:hypothetical protein
MRALVLPPDCDRLLVRPWPDAMLDHTGFDPRSQYVERFWLGIIGPSSTWLLRYVADRFDATPEGFDLDLVACAASIGLGGGQNRTSTLPRTSAFPRTVARCCQFGTARLVDPAILEVRRRLAPLSRRQVNRLPEALRAEHARWDDARPAVPSGALPGPATNGPSSGLVLADKARRLALSLLELGEDARGAEQQLERWRFPQLMAREATAWAIGRWRGPIEAEPRQA